MEFKIGNETYKLLLSGFQFRFENTVAKHDIKSLEKLQKGQAKPYNQKFLKALLDKCPDFFKKVEKAAVSTKK